MNRNQKLIHSLFRKIVVIISFVFLSTVIPLKELNSISIPKENWNLILYGGIFTTTDLIPIVFRQKTDYKESYIGSLGISRPLDYRIRWFDFLWEGNVTKHFGEMNHWEVNGFYIVKIDRMYGSPISLSLGEGLSLASENPKLENKAKGYYLDGLQKDAIESRALLNYMMVEFSSYLPFERKTELFLRVHHRSGIFGLYCPPDPNCGSNFVSYGFRTSF
ncbi:hypothetical protein [Leptospira terpstrae]|uniref:Uncharacterized protein n=1 Tax=Leptospira terpstrae serovar Hualin str. LT 11-33 = ATCC 700639 TaxID=1257025 RepID=N1W037_9LEPT|nr:hypothetical protein [Leptospira terpstrae]EMY62665.1 hypothetical protein LEP1GSC203_3443 [Leptospira terpstrae serovar Hualin str. LT 11-33 = ATCC 700639]